MKKINVTKIILSLLVLSLTTFSTSKYSLNAADNKSAEIVKNNGTPQGIILNISLPISGKSSHAIVRALERTVADIRKSNSHNKNKDSKSKPKSEPESKSTELKSELKPKPESDANSPNSTEIKNSTNADTELCPTIILQFNVDSEQEMYGRGSSFGACYEIAKLLVSDKFNSIRTVAYFPQTVKGHAMLVALACDERIIADKAEIGEASSDETTISKTEHEAYLEISRKRLAVPKAVIDKMLDPSTALMRVETEKGIRLISADEIDELGKTESFVDSPTVIIATGEPGIFTADTARKMNLVSRIASDRIELARGLGFRPDDIKTNPIPGALGHAIRIDINGPITYDKVGAVMRSIQAAVNPKSVAPNHRVYGSEKIGFICLNIDSPGGDLTASISLASFLADTKELQDVWKVAYIPYQARSDAALIALACDEITLGNTAILGGDGSVEFPKEDVENAKETIREIFSKEALRSWSIPTGFVDRNIEIFKATRTQRPTTTDYFCEEEFQELTDSTDWAKGEIIKKRGELFSVAGGVGEQYVVDRSAENFAEFKLIYGLEDDPLLVEPSWADKLVAILSSPGMSMFIMFVVFVALAYDGTGLGIGAFIAIVGICLFFWLNFLGGTAGWLEVILFAVGVLCLLVEIFLLPGLGVFGIGGAIAIILSLVFATQTFYIPRNSYQFAQVQNSAIMLCISGVGMLAVGVMIAKTLNKWSKPREIEKINSRERLASYEYLTGMEGMSITPLVPAGKAIIDNKPINVVSDGELIERGKKIRVVEVVGYRVVVTQCE
jgi:membrane-bound ClpP family serine protease